MLSSIRLRIFASGGLSLLAFGFTLELSNAGQFLPLPGATPTTPQLEEQLLNAWEVRKLDTEVRTQHVNSDGTPMFINRLILEHSPYLLQHAYTPVDWFAWDKTAFEIARVRQMPVMVSIGYSSCYWCHVMELENYDDVDTARLINGMFIAIKVDREISAEIDDLYQIAAQVMGAPGGWPLHVFVTPDGKPFFAGTYFPPDRFKELLIRIDSVWHEKKGDLYQVANEISSTVHALAQHEGEPLNIGAADIEQAIEQLAQYQEVVEDFEFDGNQFPAEPELFLLADAAVRDLHPEAQSLLTKRLDAMALGGIRDHVGGGFHRYSVDRDWLVPHFEKMLYNQAQLGRIYAYAYRMTGNVQYREVAKQTLDFVLREMTDQNGGFFSAIDAGEVDAEGEFYVWNLEELKAVLDESDAKFAAKVYGVSEAGNFEGASILFLPKPLKTVAESLEMPLEDLRERLASIRAQLLDYRNNRSRPFVDEKILSSWNGMMITTLAEASGILNEPAYGDAALRSGEFLWNFNRDVNGRLLRSHFRGHSSIPAKLDDHAFVAQAMLALYDLTSDRVWLDRAEQIAKLMIDAFWDVDRGGFNSVVKDAEELLITTPKNFADNVYPSGNTIAMEVLTRLYERTGTKVYRAYARETLQALSKRIMGIPSGFSYALRVVLEQQNGTFAPFAYAASGNVTLAADIDAADEDSLSTTVQIRLAPDWHVNANQPLSDNLQATAVEAVEDSGWIVAEASYPEAELLEADFQDEPLAVYSDEVSVKLKLQQTSKQSSIPELKVTLQACNDELCLLPESINLELIDLTWKSG